MFNFLKRKERIQDENKEIEKLKERIKELEDLLNARLSVKASMDNGIPRKTTERKQYVAQVALFYSVFKKVIENFIYLQHKELQIWGRSEKVYDFYRANINVFNLIDEWMQERVNEHFAYLQEGKTEQEKNEELINNMKHKFDV